MSVKEEIIKDIYMSDITLESFNSIINRYGEEYRKDRDVVSAGLKLDKYALRDSDDIFKKDRDMVKFAVSWNGTALEFADDTLKKDKEIVLIAIKSDGGDALYHADESFRNDKDFILGYEGIEENSILRGASKELQNDRDFVLKLVKKYAYNIKHASVELKNDSEIAFEAVKNNKYVLEHLSKNLMNSEDFVKKVLQFDIKLINYFDMDVLSNDEIFETYTKQYVEKLNISKEKWKQIYDNEKTKKIMREVTVADIYLNKNKIINLTTTSVDANLTNKVIKFSNIHQFIPGSLPVLEKIPYEKIEEFDKKVWFKIAKKDIFNINDDSKKSLVEASYILGLFKKYEKEDKLNQQNRLKFFNELTDYIPDSIPDIESVYEYFTNELKRAKELESEEPEEAERIKNSINKQKEIFDKYFNQDSTKSVKTKYILKKDASFEGIPNKALKEFEKKLDEKSYLKLLNSSNEKIRDKAKQLYDKQSIDMINITKDVDIKDREILKIVLRNSNIPDVLTFNKIHAMFNGTNMEYNEDFVKFFMKYSREIIEDSKLFNEFPKLCNTFNSIKEFKAKAGGNIKDIRLYEAYDYLDKIPYKDVEEHNLEYSKVCKRSGVTDVEYKKYQELYNKQKKRKYSSIPFVKNKVKYNDVGVSYKINDLDDPMTTLVGEVRNAACCQRINGEGESCMIHSATSENGNIFCVYNEDGALLTQSWTWKNGNVLCFDNIEATDEFIKNKKKYESTVIEAYKKAGNDLIKKSNEKIEKIKEEKLKGITNQKDKEKVLKQLETNLDYQVIKMVTVGTGNNDVNIKDNFKEQVKSLVTPEEKVKYMSDSVKQRIVSGTEENIKHENIKNEPLFKQPRRITQKEYIDININDIERIKEVEKKAHKERMQTFKNVKNISDIANIYDENKENMKTIIGDDWYCIYSKTDKKLHIYDLARDTENDSDGGLEMLKCMTMLVEDSLTIEKDEVKDMKEIEAELREDTTYMLYAQMLESGYVEKLEDEYVYEFDNDYKRKKFTEQQRKELLSNKKSIKESSSKEESTTMHKVKFKPTDKYIKRILAKRKKEREYDR